MRRLPAVVLVVAALAGSCAGASAADKPVKRPPTELWNAFPLRERPEPVADAGVAAASVTRLAPVARPRSLPLVGADSVGSDTTERLTTILLLVELALMLGAIGLAVVLFGPDLNPLAFARGRPHALRKRRLSVSVRARRTRAVTARPPGDDPEPLMPRLPERLRQPTESAVRELPSPAVISAEERCSVDWLPGYVSALFVAKSSSDAKTTLAASPTFRWRKASPPEENETTSRALAAVVERLEQEGWVPAGQAGREWFERAFVRPRKAAEACRIEWAHDYVTGRFRAVVAGADGSRTVIAESSDLRAFRGRPPERGKPANAALNELVAKLGRLGWTRTGHGDEWYAVAFVRTPPTAAGLHRSRPNR
jgi:hypothetical protein